MIQRGVLCLRQASQGDALSVYHIEASIAATHCMAADAAATRFKDNFDAGCFGRNPSLRDGGND